MADIEAAKHSTTPNVEALAHDADADKGQPLTDEDQPTALSKDKGGKAVHTTAII